MNKSTQAMPGFTWGAKIALIPGLGAIFPVGYAGVAVVNLLWRQIFSTDAPGIICFFGGVTYGLILGPIFQCVVFGSICHLIWESALKKAPIKWPKSSGPGDILILIAAVSAYIFLGPLLVLTLIGYGGPWFLSEVVGLSK